MSRLVEGGGPRWIARFRELEAAFGPTPCVAYGLAKAFKSNPTTRAPVPDDELRYALIAARAFPGQREIVLEAVTTFQRLERHREAVAFLRSALRRTQHQLHRQVVEAALISILRSLGDTAQATRIYRDARAAARGDGRPWVLYKFCELGLGAPYGLAASETRERWEIARRAGEPSLIMRARVDLASPLIESGRINDALALLEPLRSAIAHQDVPSLQMIYYRELGRALIRAGRPREALRVLDSARRAASVTENDQFIAEADHQIGHALEALGDWTTAAAAMDRFIVSASRTGDPGVRVISYHDAAGIRWKAGWHAGADSLSRLMVASIERERLHYSFAAEYYERIGDFGNALRYLHRAAERLPGGHLVDAPFYFAGLTRLNLALGRLDSAQAAAVAHDSLVWGKEDILLPKVLAVRGRPAEAVAAIRRWTEYQATRGNIRGQVRALVGLADALLKTAPAQALSVASEAERAARAQQMTLETIAAVRIGGAAAAALGHTDAVSRLHRARALAQHHPDVMQQLLTEIALGGALLAQGDRARSLAAYDRAVRLVGATAASMAGDVNTARYRAARVAAFDGAAKAVTTAERIDPELLLRWSIRKKAGRESTRPLVALRSRMTRHDALIDFFVADTIAWVTVVTRSRVATVRLPANVREIDELARSLTEPMRRTAGGRIDVARLAFDDASAHRLHEIVIGPIASELDGITRVTLVPDAPLHEIPFEALRPNAPGTSQEFLIDRWIVSYALAADRFNAPVPVGRARLLAVVGAAPGAEAEVARLRDVWTAGADVLTAEQATESIVRARVSSYSLVHFATHAESDERDPLSSYLALKADAARDGLLHYSEVEDIRRPRTLVVLNACETSAGELLAGSGFMSLARAFLLSGAANVVATQWPVGDAAGVVAGEFYRRLASGEPPDAALRGAKLALRYQAPTSHPFFWASHILLQGPAPQSRRDRGNAQLGVPST